MAHVATVSISLIQGPLAVDIGFLLPSRCEAIASIDEEALQAVLGLHFPKRFQGQIRVEGFAGGLYGGLRRV